MSTTHLTQWLVRAAQTSPEKTALVAGDEEVSWSALFQRVMKTATYLQQHHIKRGDRVVVWLPNSIDFVVCFWAVQYLQAIFVPVNPDTPVARVGWIFSNAEAALLIGSAEQAGALVAASGQRLPYPVLFDKPGTDSLICPVLLSLQQIAAQADVTPQVP